MKNYRMVLVVISLLLVALAAGAYLRDEVVKGRSLPSSTPVTDFTSCLEAGGGLDVTGIFCTSTSGQMYSKPDAVLPDVSTTTTETTTEPIPTATTTQVATATPLTLGTATKFSLHDTHTIPDNSTLILDTIADSRCKPGTECIWAGELGTVWTLAKNGRTESFNISTVRTPSFTKNGYTFTLKDTTTDTAAVITVTKEAAGNATATTSTGTVSGSVTIGPLCPVESVDRPCVIPPETYTSRSVMVYASDNVTELERHKLDATGHFNLTLKPGTYGLQIRPAGIRAGEIKPVIVIANKVATIDFDIDTGIR